MGEKITVDGVFMNFFLTFSAEFSQKSVQVEVLNKLLMSKKIVQCFQRFMIIQENA